MGKPRGRIFICLSLKIISSKYTEFKHLLWCQIGSEIWCKVFTHWLSAGIGIPFLERV
jgi:hypothetical protein